MEQCYKPPDLECIYLLFTTYSCVDVYFDFNLTKIEYELYAFIGYMLTYVQYTEN